MDKTTEKFAAYASALSYADLTPGAIHAVKRSVVDSIGCAFGAFNAPPVAALRVMASEVTATRPATLIGTAVRSSPEMAGFANSVMIRYLDFSDDYFGGTGKQAGPHPSDNIGTLLALTESNGASGKAAILGIALAYEACGHLVDHTVLHPQGWDYTVMHAVGTALGAGKILELSREQFANALGLAVVANISLWQTRLGDLSEWKAMAGPNGSRNGLFAATLAKHGITGPSDAFEGKAGFMKQLNCPFELGELGGGNTRFKIENTFFKSMAVMYSAQLPAWTALQLRKQVRVEDIESVVVYLYGYALTTGAYTAERQNPQTRETADHSSPYLIAAALVDGEINAATLTPQRFRDPTILALARKISAQEDKKYSAAYPEAFNCRLEATLKSGAVVVVHQANPKGHPANPMSDSEIEAKFLEQAGSLLSAQQSRDLLDSLWNLDKLDSLDHLFVQMRVPA